MTQRKISVVGGGASGLFAAIRASELGAEAQILEKMPRPARKLRITGKGRCNLTNIVPPERFIEHFGKNGRFLHSAFSRFNSDNLVEFLNRIGIETTVERGGRVFPKDADAKVVVDKLVSHASNLGVRIICENPVTLVILESGQVEGVVTDSERRGKVIHISDAVILATGGMSYPLTGSTGDGYQLAESVGHSLVPVRPSLVPLETNEDKILALHALSLRNISARLVSNGRKIEEFFGDMLFHDKTLTGPVILSLSKSAVVELNNGNRVEISIDLKPALDEKKLDARLLRDFAEFPNRIFKSLLRRLMPANLIDVCLAETGISPEKTANSITQSERKILLNWLKDFRFEISSHRPHDEAIITAGGVNLKEIDPRTMQSKIIGNLFFAGEILDLDADTGGYNLQAAFSTGWIAGESAAGISD